MKKSIIIVLTILTVLNFYDGYSQVRKVYSSIETQNVLYYKVEEIVNMTFGGTTTWYTVSDLSLISKVYLGPDNIRIITPIYKEEKFRKKYYIETQNSNKILGKKQEPTKLVEIAISEKSIEIPEDPQLPNASLALVISNLTNLEPVPVVNTEPQRVGPDFILVRVVEVYERVLRKGYKSAYMLKEVANFYYFKDQMDEAVKWYEELFAMTNDLAPVFYYRFGYALKKTGNAERGDAMVEKFNQLTK